MQTVESRQFQLNLGHAPYNNPLRYTDPNGHTTCLPVCTPVDVQTVLHVYEIVAENAPKAAAFGTSLLFKVATVAGYALTFGAEPVGVGSSLDEHPEIQQQQQEGQQEQQEGEPEPEADASGAGQGSKGGDTRRTTREKHSGLEGAQDQRESLDHAQQKLRKTGQGEKIRSTEKTKQNEKTELKKIKSSEDLKEEKP